MDKPSCSQPVCSQAMEALSCTSRIVSKQIDLLSLSCLKKEECLRQFGACSLLVTYTNMLARVCADGQILILGSLSQFASGMVTYFW